MTSEELIADLTSEIHVLEGLLELTPDESERLAELKKQVAQLEKEVAIQRQLEAEAGKPTIAIRKLESRDISLLRKIIGQQSDLSVMTPVLRVDHLVLFLTTACGYGGVTEDLIRQVARELSLTVPESFTEHLETAIWQTRSGETRKCYVKPFANAFKLDPGYALKIAQPTQKADEVLPVRRKVAAPTSVPMSRPTTQGFAPVRPVAIVSGGATTKPTGESTAGHLQKASQSELLKPQNHGDFSRGPRPIESNNEQEVAALFGISPTKRRVWMIVSALGALLLALLWMTIRK